VPFESGLLSKAGFAPGRRDPALTEKPVNTKLYAMKALLFSNNSCKRLSGESFVAVKRKNSSTYGFTLPGIAAVALLIGIFAICCTVFFGNAARVRMDARQRQAALIQANSLMERACEAVDASVYTNMGAAAWFAVEADGSLSYSGVNPLETWTVDGKALPLSITVTKVGGWDRFVDITVAVNFDSGAARAVTLNAYRYCSN
jgi:hypothetical protein